MIESRKDELIKWLSDNLFHKDFEVKNRELNLLCLKTEKPYIAPSELSRIKTENKYKRLEL